MRITLCVRRKHGNHSFDRLLQMVILSLILLFCSTPIEAGTMVPLTVDKGTGLIKLARKFCTSEYHWRELARLNNLQPPYRIFPGEKLYVPIELLKVKKVSGHVAAVSGTVYLIKGDAKLEKIQKGDTILPGQTMVTEADGFAHIIYPNNRYTKVASNSRFSLTYMVKLVDDSLQAEFYLEKGRITHVVKKKLKPHDSFQTRTPVSVTGVRGTEFRLKMLDEARNVVETLQGAVDVDAAGVSFVVPSGFGSVIEKGKSPEKPQKLPPAPSAPKIAEIYQALPIVIPTVQNNFSDQYRIRVALDENGNHTVLEQKVITGENFKFITLADGIYYSFLTSMTAAGLESRPAKPIKFQLRTVPAPPILTDRNAGKSLFKKTVSIKWLEQENVGKYHLQLASTPNFSTVLNDWYNTDSVVNLQDLSPGKYYFRVQAVAKDGFHSLFSAIDPWIIEADPAISDISESPQHGLALHWTDMGEGVLYDLQVSTVNTFTTNLAEISGLKLPKFTYNEKLEPGTYYVRVRGVLINGQKSPWSVPNSIKIDNPPFSIFDGAVFILFLAVLVLI